ncbi:MAG: ABC transporter substrate-binding protein [Deltaproteobacteria bacterium]|nr:MAG: ABC transporter substrate-binding protein [Deltaproteobacteria bacterium]
MSNAGWMAILLSLSVTSFPGLTRSAFAAERAGRLSPLRIAIVSRSTLDMPFYVARERGFFREEGLEAEIIFMKGNLTVQGMLGGSIDFGTATGTAVSAAVNGADVRVVFAMSDKPSFDLIARQENRHLRGRSAYRNSSAPDPDREPGASGTSDLSSARHERCDLRGAKSRRDRRHHGPDSAELSCAR